MAKQRYKDHIARMEHELELVKAQRDGYWQACRAMRERALKAEQELEMLQQQVHCICAPQKEITGFSVCGGVCPAHYMKAIRFLQQRICELYKQLGGETNNGRSDPRAESLGHNSSVD